jgi:hypothetical protein
MDRRKQWRVEVQEGSNRRWAQYSFHDSRKEAEAKRDELKAGKRFRGVRIVNPPWTG